MSERTGRNGSNPWKITTLALVIGLPALVLGAAVIANLSEDSGQEAPPAVSSASPSPDAIDDCNQYAAAVREGKDLGRIAKDALIGAAAGAGVGAAGGAIVDGGSGAGKGAGVGAVVGAAAGTAYGLNEENRKSEEARRAYRECMAKRGY